MTFFCEKLYHILAKNSSTIHGELKIASVAFTIIYILMGKYMNTRVGLKPEEYSKYERKYDELKADKVAEDEN